NINQAALDINQLSISLLTAYIQEFGDSIHTKRNLFVTCFKKKNEYMIDEYELEDINLFFGFETLPLYNEFPDLNSVSLFNGLSFSIYSINDQENFNNMIRFLEKNQLETLKAIYEVLYSPTENS